MGGTRQTNAKRNFVKKREKKKHWTRKKINKESVKTY
jgi:hypothetical protein